MPINDFYQTSDKTLELTGSLSSIDMISKKDLIYGRMPENENEIVVDKFTIENMYNSSSGSSQMLGLKKAKDVLNRDV